MEVCCVEWLVLQHGHDVGACTLQSSDVKSETSSTSVGYIRILLIHIIHVAGLSKNLLPVVVLIDEAVEWASLCICLLKATDKMTRFVALNG